MSLFILFPPWQIFLSSEAVFGEHMPECMRQRQRDESRGYSIQDAGGKSATKAASNPIQRPIIQRSVDHAR